jgi:orotate phosphoribosyltransferase
VRSAGGAVAGAAVLVDRSGGASRLDVPVHSLWRLDIPSYAPAQCPLCAKGIPATHPGTTPAPAVVSR